MLKILWRLFVSVLCFDIKSAINVQDVSMPYNIDVYINTNIFVVNLLLD